MLNFAIAGLGIWGRTLVEALQGKSDKARFTVAVVRNAEARADFAKAQGLRLVSGLEEALVDHDIAGVVLATLRITNPDVHGEFAFPLAFRSGPTGWQLTRDTAEMLLAFSSGQ